MLPKIPPELELAEILSHVLARHANVGALNGALDQRPKALNRIDVRVARDVLLAAVQHGAVNEPSER